jgi:outer membrane protein OmpA-like peptidoglycan-associated protein
MKVAAAASFVVLLLACGGAQKPRPKVVILGTSIVIVDADSNEQVPIEVPFEVDSAKLDPESHGMLDALAMFLDGNPDLKLIEIQGHTDDRGVEAENYELSVDRAKAVLDYLVSKRVDPARLRSKGFGSSRPAVRGRGEAAWSQNRRVEFLIIQRN